MIDFKSEKRLFFRFLKENGIYSQYRKYIHNPRTQGIYQRFNKNWSFNKCAEEYGIEGIVSLLIYWAATEEGSNYWSDISIKWQSTLSKYRIDNEKENSND